MVSGQARARVRFDRGGIRIGRGAVHPGDRAHYSRGELSRGVSVQRYCAGIRDLVRGAVFTESAAGPLAYAWGYLIASNECSTKRERGETRIQFVGNAP